MDKFYTIINFVLSVIMTALWMVITISHATNVNALTLVLMVGGAIALIGACNVTYKEMRKEVRHA